MILKLSKRDAGRLLAALSDAIRDRKEFIRCNLEPFRGTVPPATLRQVAKEEKQIAFCREMASRIHFARKRA